MAMKMNTTDKTRLDPKWGESSPLHQPQILANFKARIDDVLIATPPKAGTTWMQQILHQLKTGGDENFEDIDHVVPWLEIQRRDKSWQDVLDEFEKIESPRIFKTHCTYEQMPGVDTAKIILTTRDPRDCCLSFYHHLLDLTDYAIQLSGVERPQSLDEYVNTWLEFAAWYRNIKSWWPHKDQSNILILRYEDLRKNFDYEIERILEFLGWSLNDSQCQQVNENCSFEWMKKNVQRFNRQGFSSSQSLFKPDGFVRKGAVGEGKQKLSADQQQRILQKAREMLDVECLKFLEID